MQNKIITMGPVALTTTLTTNILNPATTTGGVSAGGTTYANTYILVRHIHVSNKTTAAATFSLWKGATGANAAGTEFIGTGVSVPANSYLDFYGVWRFDVTDFLVGGASAATALTLEMEGEIGLA